MAKATITCESIEVCIALVEGLRDDKLQVANLPSLQTNHTMLHVSQTSRICSRYSVQQNKKCYSHKNEVFVNAIFAKLCLMTISITYL